LTVDAMIMDKNGRKKQAQCKFLISQECQMNVKNCIEGTMNRIIKFFDMVKGITSQLDMCKSLG